MTDEINGSELKKWDVHFRGSDKVLCVEAETSPEEFVTYGAGWLRQRDGGMINLAHVLAIVPHIEPADAAPPAPDARPNLRDRDGDIWEPIDGTDSYRLRGDLIRNRGYIENVYSPVTEV